MLITLQNSVHKGLKFSSESKHFGEGPSCLHTTSATLPVSGEKSPLSVSWNPLSVTKNQHFQSIRAECRRHEARRWEHSKMYPPQMYPNPTIQSRSAARRAAQDLVFKTLPKAQRTRGLSSVTSWSHITNSNTNLDHISSSESQLSIKNLNQTEVSE